MNRFIKFKKFNIHSDHIINQHRFPIAKYGWPLKEVAEIIIERNIDWYQKSFKILKNHIERRKGMRNLGDLYGIKELNKWNIDTCFIPWFSQKPILSKTIYDTDFTEIESADISIKKICNLISSIEKFGFKEDTHFKNKIMVYPLDLGNNCFYVRAGNHRVATLSAFKKKIPCILDHTDFLKPRDKIIISKYIWKYNTGNLYKDYPNLKSIKNMPAVKSKIITPQSALEIMKLFCK